MKVAVLSKSFAKASDQPITLLENAGIEVLQRPNDDPANEERVAELIGDCDGAIVAAQDRVGSIVFDRCPKLRVVADHAVGFDRIDMEVAQRRGIVVKTCPGNYESVADLAWLFILASARKLLPAVQSVKDGQWSPPAFSGAEVLHKTIGIVGYGQIGRAVIQRAQGFENKILVYDPFVRNIAPVGNLEIAHVSLDALLEQSDVVSLHVPLSEGTRYIIDSVALSKMKRSATLINTSRGGLVDEAALHRALTDGTIAAAATDVFETEPPGNNPLLGLPNFIATPHLGAQTADANIRTGMMAARIIIDVLTKNTNS
ncbi:MAG: phosphoglycerate dehydrogenase [Cyclobacteriaceae bacterium]|nr:phosphoglycerate dehydrogenase [Cyclobacteriaceae bacterium]